VCGGNGKSCAGCDGVANSGKVKDACGVCGGNGKSCAGCDGVANSRKVNDACGVCGGDGSSCAGCDGVANSGKSFDLCGVCGGDNSSCAGCDGKANSGKVVDKCGVCGGDGSSCAPKPKPKPAPKGDCACDSGIEGKVQGGGKVCCPAACGGPRFSGAPNACGGPGCDKGVDGKRDTFRFFNCCVGKPVSLTETGTITAPYGIVATGRTCDKHGPPCILRNQKDDTCNSAPAKPAACSCSSGVQGNVQGGGKVCCPAACGTMPRFAGAVNACGGANCDKGPDGKRDLFRYNNCCVGKPVSLTDAGKPTAPYGIVSTQRYCDKQAPPCILQDQKGASCKTGATDKPGAPGTMCVARTGSSPLPGNPKFWCCAASCGTCGGVGCSKRKGGSDKCCIQKIRAAAKSCAGSSPPCAIFADAKAPCVGCDKSPKKNGGGGR